MIYGFWLRIKIHLLQEFWVQARNFFSFCSNYSNADDSLKLWYQLRNDETFFSRWSNEAFELSFLDNTEFDDSADLVFEWQSCLRNQVIKIRAGCVFPRRSWGHFKFVAFHFSASLVLDVIELLSKRLSTSIVSPCHSVQEELLTKARRTVYMIWEPHI